MPFVPKCPRRVLEDTNKINELRQRPPSVLTAQDTASSRPHPSSSPLGEDGETRTVPPCLGDLLISAALGDQPLWRVWYNML